MRRLSFVLLISAIAWGGPSLRQIASKEYVGISHGIAPIAIGEGFLPAVLTQRPDPRGHFRVADLDMGTRDQAKLRGDAMAIGRIGGGVAVATRYKDEIRVMEVRYEGRHGRTRDHGRFAVGDLQDMRILSMAEGDGNAPLLVISHRTGLVITTVRERGRGHSDVFARPRGRVMKATRPFKTRDGKMSIFAVDNGLRLLHFQQKGRGWELVREVPLNASGFQLRAMTATKGQLWLAGAMGGKGTLMLFDAAALRGKHNKRVPKELRGFIKTKITPTATLQFGAGWISHVELLSDTQLVVAGTKDGRAWVGVTRSRTRATLENEVFLPGSRVVAIGLNPARKGWSIAVAVQDKHVRLLRIPGDLALPRNWDPAPVETDPQPDPEPQPQPDPRPDPRPVPVPVDPGGARGPAWNLTTAVLPRLQCDERAREDTEIVLVNVGRRAARAKVSFVAPSGRTLVTLPVTLKPGQKATVSTLGELRQLGVPSFNGYARIDGIAKRDLIVEGVLTSRERDGHRIRETLQAHWR